MNLTGTRLVILLSGLATALLHLFLFPRLGVDPIVLNGLGYLALLGAYLLPISFFQERRGLIWWLLVGYTVLTFILWIILGSKEFALDLSTPAIGYYARFAEIILLISLWLDKSRSK